MPNATSTQATSSACKSYLHRIGSAKAVRRYNSGSYHNDASDHSALDSDKYSHSNTSAFPISSLPVPNSSSGLAKDEESRAPHSSPDFWHRHRNARWHDHSNPAHHLNILPASLPTAYANQYSHAATSVRPSHHQPPTLRHHQGCLYKGQAYGTEFVTPTDGNSYEPVERYFFHLLPQVDKVGRY